MGVLLSLSSTAPADVVIIHSARLLLKLILAQSRACTNDESEGERQIIWQGILSDANEVVSVLQSWNPAYFDTVDPMCSHVVYLAASVHIINGNPTPDSHGPTSSQHVDLASLFLSRVGQHWPIGEAPVVRDLYQRSITNYLQGIAFKVRHVIKRCRQVVHRDPTNSTDGEN